MAHDEHSVPRHLFHPLSLVSQNSVDERERANGNSTNLFSVIIGDGSTRMSKPNNIKKQRFVPQFYLKNFAGRKGQFYVFDKTASKQYAANVRDVAQKHGFYNISHRPGSLSASESFDPQCIEHTLSAIELPLSRVIKDVLETAWTQGIHPRKRHAVATFLTLQLYRTAEFREVMMEYTQKAMRHRIEEWMKSNYPDDLKLTPRSEWSDDYWVAAQSLFMFEPEFMDNMRDYLNSLYWLVGVNRTDISLYTSDSPVTYFSHFPIFSRECGIKSPGVEIVCPLSPKMALILRDKDLPAYLTLPSGIIVEDRDRANDGGMTDLSAENVSRFNGWQAARCHRQVFSMLADFTIARTFCQENPEMCVVDRERWE